MKVRREAVGNIDATRGDANELHAECDFRLRLEMAALRRFDELPFGVIGAFRSALLQRESGRRAADWPAEIDAIASPRSAAENGLTCFANQRDGDEETFGSRKIAADNLDA